MLAGHPKQGQQDPQIARIRLQHLLPEPLCFGPASAGSMNRCQPSNHLLRLRCRQGECLLFDFRQRLRRICFLLFLNETGFQQQPLDAGFIPCRERGECLGCPVDLIGFQKHAHQAGSKPLVGGGLPQGRFQRLDGGSRLPFLKTHLRTQQRLLIIRNRVRAEQKPQQRIDARPIAIERFAIELLSDSQLQQRSPHLRHCGK